MFNILMHYLTFYTRKFKDLLILQMIAIVRQKSLRNSEDIPKNPLTAMFAEEPTTDIINVQEDALKQN